MASARKRPRVENEENRAECPFSVRIVDPKDKEQKKNKKRRRTEGGEDDDVEKKSNLQLSPFSPSGKFKTYGTMDVHYQVDPAKKWTDMTRYNSFVRKFWISTSIPYILHNVTSFAFSSGRNVMRRLERASSTQAHLLLLTLVALGKVTDLRLRDSLPPRSSYLSSKWSEVL